MLFPSRFPHHRQPSISVLRANTPPLLLHKAKHKQGEDYVGLLSSGKMQGGGLGWERGSPVALFLTYFRSPTPHGGRAWETILYEINDLFCPVHGLHYVFLETNC